MPAITKFEMNGLDSIDAVRECDELGSINLTIKGEDGTSVEIFVGRYEDDAMSLRDMLHACADDIDRSIITGWEDVPDEYDAFVSFDRDGYYVSIEGMLWDGAMLVSQSNSRHIRPFPSREIAEYELACAMNASGIYPNAWFVNDRGNTFNIAEDVRKHEEADGRLRTPAGVVFEDDQEVMVDGWRAYVVKDYGDMGVIYVLSGDDTRHFTEDHESLVPVVDDDEEEDA